jgi:hypothetical protein
MREMADSKEIDPYGEEDWEDKWVEKMKEEIKRIGQMFEYLQNQAGDIYHELGYELIFIGEEYPVSIELLKEEDDGELLEDDTFFFGIYFDTYEDGNIVSKTDQDISRIPIASNDPLFEYTCLRKLKNLLSAIKTRKEINKF